MGRTTFVGFSHLALADVIDAGSRCVIRALEDRDALGSNVNFQPTSLS